MSLTPVPPSSACLSRSQQNSSPTKAETDNVHSRRRVALSDYPRATHAPLLWTPSSTAASPESLVMRIS
ncbi:hypothetical protein QTJ16_003038 [Diplocarpon rosae]|uniref:Uncharacterized protein n=1 Tax=Diplocarpon rosae TaxID=946125 RepID=A0AAD9T0V7_9HELO|nr:hypothetical protein QTJ16_003038 [Diplocarpon rosae]